MIMTKNLLAVIISNEHLKHHKNSSRNKNLIYKGLICVVDMYCKAMKYLYDNNYAIMFTFIEKTCRIYMK